VVFCFFIVLALTFVFVIALIGKGSPKLIEWRFTVLFNNELIAVIRRHKFKKLFTEIRIEKNCLYIRIKRNPKKVER